MESSPACSIWLMLLLLSLENGNVRGHSHPSTRKALWALDNTHHGSNTMEQIHRQGDQSRKTERRKAEDFKKEQFHE